MSLINEIKNEFIKVLSAFAGVPASGDTSTSADVEKTYSPSEISLSDRVVGSKVELINKDGSLSVAPDGNYEVDGFEFTVKDGLISAIEGQESPVDENMSADAPATPNPEIEALKAEIDTLKSQIADLVKSIAGLNEGSENFASKKDVQEFKSVVETLNTNMLKLAKLPAEPAKTSNNFDVKKATEDKRLEFASLLGSSKK